MIKIIMLTGFLGSGKTTMLNHLINQFSKVKIGVIVNDFGSINVDSKLIKKEGLEFKELSNGSIFCACLKDKFVDSLIEMSTRDIEYLLIEASGLADPSNMSQILKGISPYTKLPLELYRSICIIDSTSFLDIFEVLLSVKRQIKYSNIVLINKIDLIDSNTYDKITKQVCLFNCNAKMIPTIHCQIDLNTIFDNDTSFLPESDDTTNLINNRPFSLVCHADSSIEYEKFESFLNHIKPSTYRIKGFFNTIDGSFKVSCVGKYTNIQKWHQYEKTEFVLISSIGVKLLSNVLQTSKEILDNSLYI